MFDRDDSFFRALVSDHVSGQLKVAPEHCSEHVLDAMGKAPFSLFCDFEDKYFALSKRAGKEQYIVPYLMSSHPGSRLEDAIELALMLKKRHLAPEQVQDFYPTPGTVSTVAYYTGIDPLTEKKIYVCTDYHEKQLQRALLQFNRPENAPLVREALTKADRVDLIGYTAECLVRPERNAPPRRDARPKNGSKPRQGAKPKNGAMPRQGAKAKFQKNGNRKKR